MNEITLEQEFEYFKSLHKYSLVKACLIKYYYDLNMSNGINIHSDLLIDKFEESALEDIEKLLNSEDGTKKFDEAYEKMWSKYSINFS